MQQAITCTKSHQNIQRHMASQWLHQNKAIAQRHVASHANKKFISKL